jgi:hypothetical protein
MTSRATHPAIYEKSRGLGDLYPDLFRLRHERAESAPTERRV